MTYLVLEVRKLDFSTLCIGFIRSDLTDFLSFLLLLIMTLLSLTTVIDKVQASSGLVFNIEMSLAAVLLKS